MTVRAETEGKPSHALVEMYTQAIKIVIIVAYFSVRGITLPWTAKWGSGNTIWVGRRMKGYVKAGELLNWKAAHF